ncbi:oligopeptide/dipeptide ABC transporter ATP-binding protein [Nonomuraea aurantiaca]|uniref:oligopeptide/dipeptide ABC transporter ATP-binding protein n=1 Tax=Nonomuraea aurantiaca TaxID=2878562 RepID=UPI001CDA4B03|nr:oligopeptide/dipeptide ABC transporter ATP-binding protein [Nonomuraea aurantiaca]MCA2223913.1 hypothetical protein [Nonomuraea aurantiaca]
MRPRSPPHGRDQGGREGWSSPPDLHSVPSGCAFRARCPMASDVCAAERPVLVEAGPGRLSACHHWKELTDD